MWKGMYHFKRSDSRQSSTSWTALAVCLLLGSCEVVFGGAESKKNTNVYINESAQHSECKKKRDAKTELASIRAVLSTLISSVHSLLSAGGTGRTHSPFASCYFAVSEYLLVDDSSFFSDDLFLSFLRRNYLQPEIDRQRKGIETIRTEVRGAVGSCNACEADNCTCVCFTNKSACSITDSGRLNKSALNFLNKTFLSEFKNSTAKLQALLQRSHTAFAALQKSQFPADASPHRALLAANTLAGLLESLESSLTLIPCTRTSNASRCINVGRLRTAIAAATKDHLVLNSSLLLAQLNSLKVIRSASRTFSTVFPFFWPEDDWKAFQRNISTALCNALFPTCPGGFSSPLRTCYETCGALRKFEDILNWPLLKGTPFSLSNSALILTLARSSCPRNVLQGEPCVFASPSSHCYSCSVRRIVTVQTSNVSETKTAPLQIPCATPLQKTSVKEHYIPAIRDHIRSAAAKIFNATLNWTNDDIDGLFPCSIGCSTAGYSPKSASNIKAAQVTLSWLVLLSSATACFFHIRNLSAEKALIHRRLVLCFNINFLVLAISFLPPSFNWDRLYCHGDGTLRQSEPSSDFMCSLLGTMAYAGVLMHSFLLACLSHLWLGVVRQLKKTTVKRKDRKQESKIFIIYLTASLLPTVVLTTVMLALQQINGTPITGTCAVSFTHLFPLLTVPVSIASLIAVTFLIAGLSLLFPAWKKATKVGRRLRARSPSTMESPQTASQPSTQSRKKRLLGYIGRKFSSVRSTSQSSEALRLLILQLSLFVVASMAMAATNIAFGIIVYKDKDKWDKGSYTFESITCKLMTARKLRYTCPDIPIVSGDVIITLLGSFGAAGITLSGWVAFKEKGGSRRGSARLASKTSSSSTALQHLSH